MLISSGYKLRIYGIGEIGLVKKVVGFLKYNNVKPISPMPQYVCKFLPILILSINNFKNLTLGKRKLLLLQSVIKMPKWRNW